MSEKTALSLIEYGAGGTTEPPPPPPEEEGQPGGSRRKPQRPAGMGTGGKPPVPGTFKHPNPMKLAYTGKNRLAYGMDPAGSFPDDFVHPPEGKDPAREMLRAGGMEREMTADDVLDAYRAALAGGGQKFMPHISRMGGAVGMPNIGRPKPPGLESEAQQTVNNLLDSDTLAERAPLSPGEEWWQGVQRSPEYQQAGAPRKKDWVRGMVRRSRKNLGKCTGCGGPLDTAGPNCSRCQRRMEFFSGRSSATEGEARQIADLLLDGSEEEANLMIEEAKKKAAKGRMVAKSPGKVSYNKEDCGVTYPGHGLSTKGKGKKAKTVAKAPGKVTYRKK